MEYYRRAVDGGVFVVAGGESSPLLQVAEAALDDVAVPVITSVECDGAAAARAAPFAVAFLIVRLGGHGHGRVRGRPMLRPTRSWASKGRNIGESPAWPGVINVTSGSPFPSTS